MKKEWNGDDLQKRKVDSNYFNCDQDHEKATIHSDLSKSNHKYSKEAIDEAIEICCKGKSARMKREDFLQKVIAELEKN